MSFDVGDRIEGFERLIDVDLESFEFDVELQLQPHVGF